MIAMQMSRSERVYSAIVTSDLVRPGTLAELPGEEERPFCDIQSTFASPRKAVDHQYVTGVHCTVLVRAQRFPAFDVVGNHYAARF